MIINVLLIDEDLWGIITGSTIHYGFISYMRAIKIQDGYATEVWDLRSSRGDQDLELIHAPKAREGVLAARALGLDPLSTLNYLLTDPSYWDKYSQYALKKIHSLLSK